MAVSKKTRFEVFKRDRFTCCYCGLRPPEVTLEADHVVPVTEGGGDDIENLTTSCFDCNRGKGARTLGDVAPTIDELEVLAAVQETLERKRVLTASLAAEKEVYDVEEQTIEVIQEWWSDSIAVSMLPEKESLRSFVRKLDIDEIRDAVVRCSQFYNEKPYTPDDRVLKYFYAVCWKKIKGDKVAT